MKYKFVVILSATKEQGKFLEEEIKQKLTENGVVCEYVEPVKAEYRRLDEVKQSA